MPSWGRLAHPPPAKRRNRRAASIQLTQLHWRRGDFEPALPPRDQPIMKHLIPHSRYQGSANLTTAAGHPCSRAIGPVRGVNQRCLKIEASHVGGIALRQGHKATLKPWSKAMQIQSSLWACKCGPIRQFRNEFGHSLKTEVTCTLERGSYALLVNMV